jgi:hypothetical protein
MLLLRVGSGGIAWQKWGLLIALITMSYQWIDQVLGTLRLSFPHELTFFIGRVADHHGCAHTVQAR